MSENLNLHTIDTVDVSPFKKLVMTVGELPTSFVESMTYYEALAWFVKFLQTEIIPAVNNNAEAVEELQGLFTTLYNYVHDYFDNLDVQEEINHKLDEMAESGQLTDIIAQYLTLAGVLAYDTLNDLKTATNITNGSICRTLGTDTYKDGKGYFYKIRNKTPDDVIDEDNLISLTNNLLVGEKIKSLTEIKVDSILSDDNDCELISKFSYDLSSYYTILKLPKNKYDFNLIPYLTNYNDGVYKYVDEHPNSFYANGPLESPNVINGVVVANSVPVNAEYWYFLGFDSNGNVKYTKDINRTYTGNDLLNELGYYNAFGIWCPLIINGNNFDPSTELDNTDPNYDYIINGNNSKCVFGYNDDYYFFVYIEARTPRSKGITFAETQTFLQSLNITNAFNMDGGSSSQLWVSNPTSNLIFQDLSLDTKGYSSHRAWELIKITRKD